MNMLQTRRFNLEALLRTVLLFGFAFFFYRSVISGRVLYYVNPKIIPFVNFGVVIMLIMGLFSLREIFTIPRRKFRTATYTLFLLSLLTALLLPPVYLDSASLTGRTIDLGKGFSREKPAEKQASPKKENIEPGSSSLPMEKYSKEDSPFSKEEETIIVVDDLHFVTWLYDLYYNYKKYIGRDFQITGFVFRTDDYAENEFAIARLVMVCCTADMQIAGIMCKGEGSIELEKDTWVQIKGILQEGEFEGQKIPFIILTEVKEIEKSENEYVYPN